VKTFIGKLGKMNLGRKYLLGNDDLLADVDLLLKYYPC
jgi:hypothetical protein